jgi:hypothetical protein
MKKFMKKIKKTLVKVKQFFLKFKDLEDSKTSKYELLTLLSFVRVGRILDLLDPDSESVRMLRARNLFDQQNSGLTKVHGRHSHRHNYRRLMES